MPWDPHSSTLVIVILGMLYPSFGLPSPWKFHKPEFIDSQVATEPSCVPAPCWVWGCMVLDGPLRPFQNEVSSLLVRGNIPPKFSVLGTGPATSPA